MYVISRYDRGNVTETFYYHKCGRHDESGLRGWSIFYTSRKFINFFRHTIGTPVTFRNGLMTKKIVRL